MAKKKEKLFKMTPRRWRMIEEGIQELGEDTFPTYQGWKHRIEWGDYDWRSTVSIPIDTVVARAIGTHKDGTVAVIGLTADGYTTEEVILQEGDPNLVGR